MFCWSCCVLLRSVFWFLDCLLGQLSYILALLFSVGCCINVLSSSSSVVVMVMVVVVVVVVVVESVCEESMEPFFTE